MVSCRTVKDLSIMSVSVCAVCCSVTSTHVCSIEHFLFLVIFFKKPQLCDRGLQRSVLTNDLAVQPANKLLCVLPYSFPKTYSLGCVTVQFQMPPWHPGTLYLCAPLQPIACSFKLRWAPIFDVIFSFLFFFKKAYFYL